MQLFDRFQGPFLKSVAVLASGTAMARVIPMLTSPILTRLYTPADFGMLAVFMAVVSPLTPAICGKYEVAMVLLKSNKQGLHLLGISIRIAIVISLIFLLTVVLFEDMTLSILNAQQLGAWIYLAPPMLLLTGVMTALNYYANRYKKYGNMAKGMMVNALTVAGTSITLGYMGLGFCGLLVGSTLGLVAVNIYLFFIFRKQITSGGLLKWGRAKAALMKKYSDYPLYNASTGLLNGLTVAMPIFFLTHYFPEAIVGYFSLMLRVVNTPLAFISGSVSEINLKKIADLVNDKVAVRPYLLKVTFALIAIISLPTIILVLFSPEIFSFVFGAEWGDAGIYMQILMPAMAVRFVASTLSTTLGATQRNRLGAIWKVIAFIATVAVFAMYAPKRDAIILFKAIAVTDITLYFLCYLFIWKAAGNPKN